MSHRRSGLPTPEELLADYASRLERHRTGRVVLWLLLSRLERANRHSGDLQLAANQLNPLVRQYSGEAFALRSGDIVICLKAPREADLVKALLQVRYAFSHDPLMQQAGSEGEETFVRRLALETDYAEFLRLVEAANGVQASPAGEVQGAVDPDPLDDPAPDSLGPRIILTRDDLAGDAGRAARASAHSVALPPGLISIDRLTEREPIVEIGRQGPALFGIRYCVPNHAADAVPQFAEAILKGRFVREEVLVGLERSAIGVLAERLMVERAERVVLSLRHGTLMSPDFALLDRTIGPQGRGRIWMSLRALDCEKDPETSAYVFKFLGGRGYRVGIGLTSAIDAIRLEAMLPECGFVELPAAERGAFSGATGLGLGRFLPDRCIFRDLRSGQDLREIRKIGGRIISGAAAEALLTARPAAASRA